MLLWPAREACNWHRVQRLTQCSAWLGAVCACYPLWTNWHALVSYHAVELFLCVCIVCPLWPSRRSASSPLIMCSNDYLIILDNFILATSADVENWAVHLSPLSLYICLWCAIQLPLLTRTQTHARAHTHDRNLMCVISCVWLPIGLYVTGYPKQVVSWMRQVS